MTPDKETTALKAETVALGELVQAVLAEVQYLTERSA
jgi:hypothetical protein